MTDPVVQVIRESNNDILYTIRIQGRQFRPEVFASGRYTIRVGQDQPNARTFRGIEASALGTSQELFVAF